MNPGAVGSNPAADTNTHLSVKHYVSVLLGRARQNALAGKIIFLPLRLSWPLCGLINTIDNAARRTRKNKDNVKYYLTSYKILNK